MLAEGYSIIIVNNRRSKHEKCTLNTSRMVEWFETKLKEVSFFLDLALMANYCCVTHNPGVNLEWGYFI